MSARRELLPRPSRGDQSIMLLALALAIVLVLAMVGVLVLLARWAWFAAAFYVLALVLGWTLAVLRRPRAGDRDRPAEARLTELLRAPCLMADLPVPDVRVHTGLPPLSWTTQAPFGRPRISVTAAMVARLDERGLQAALAHELAHVANGDARIMTLLAGPATALLTAFWSLRHVADWGPGMLAFLAMGLAAPPALVLMLLARVVSRHRELAADRGAAALTGSPAALAAALISLGDALLTIPRQDLRETRTGDVFHLMPAREATGVARLWATHPRLSRRLAALAAMERHLQG